ncbi:MAG: hypothetical protein RBR45_00635 [Pseudomonas sp.]|nr:hypothetical protein [Pseudomonas sp.]
MSSLLLYKVWLHRLFIKRPSRDKYKRCLGRHVFQPVGRAITYAEDLND